MKIAAITMARNDDFFLNRWIKYYGQEFGEKNLYIYLDGLDQKIPSLAKNVNIKKIYHIESLSRSQGDKYRISLLSKLAKDLFNKGYDLVIGCDCDEFLIPDPYLNMTLKNYLENTKIKTSLSGLGLDIGQNLNTEKKLNLNKSFLSQRSFAYLSTRYTKPVVISKPVIWGSGFHCIKKHNFKIGKDLYLLHFGSCDINMIKSKIKTRNKDWENHLKRRAKTCFIITKNKKFNFSIVKTIRIIQTIFRPFYAWNKPFLFGLKFVVTLPERFKKINI